MDRVSYFGTVICLFLMVIWFIYMERHYPSGVFGSHRLPVTPITSTQVIPPLASNIPTPEPKPPLTTPTLSPGNQSSAPASVQTGDEVESELSNEKVKVTATSRGASLWTVELKTHFEGSEPVILNQNGWHGIMSLIGWNNPAGAETNFKLESATPTSLTYSTTLPNQIQWTRTITLNPDSFVLNFQDSLTNPTSSDIILPDYSLALGRSNSLRSGGYRIFDSYLGGSFFGTSKSWLGYNFGQITLSDFNSSTFLFIFRTRGGSKLVDSTSREAPPLKWAAAQNQFFAQMLIPPTTHPITKDVVICYNKNRDSFGDIPQGKNDPDAQLDSFAVLSAFPVGPKQTVTIPYTVYAGPKEYDLLSKLGPTEAEILNYGNFWVLILPMRYCLHLFYHFWGSYGLAIMTLTLLIKIITWPIQSATYRAGKRMQALAPMLKELSEKFKDKQDRLLSEQRKLYSEYNINPLGGCWMGFIQVPVFFSLYFMLQTAVELRNTSFLWIKDLTQPDALYTFTYGESHFTLNLLPILVTGTMMAIMRITPTPGMDPTQAKVMQIMPLFYLGIFYQFGAALSLYYIINNSVAIFQVWRNSKKPLPPLKKREVAKPPEQVVKQVIRNR